jgi:hypothetical protein
MLFPDLSRRCQMADLPAQMPTFPFSTGQGDGEPDFDFLIQFPWFRD